MKKFLFILLLGGALTGCWNWEPKELVLKPTASFTVSNDGCTTGCTITFTSTSSNATSYAWDFGDGTTSSLVNPAKQFTAAGTYTVKLTATNRAGSTTAQQTVTINAQPTTVASFTYTGGDCVVPCEVTFIDQSTNATSYTWDFGDTGTSTEQNPKHTYNRGGTYSVKLTVKGAGGTDTLSRTLITKIPESPVASFTVINNNCTAPCAVTFINTSKNATTYSWNFGDTSTSTQTDPVKQYASGGTYTVTLSASGPTGSHSSSQTVTIDGSSVSTRQYLNSVSYSSMVLVKGGTFQMGDARNEGDTDETLHTVTLSDFYMGQYEVTQRQWQTVMGTNTSPAYFTGCDDCPVENISWIDAQAFLTKINQQRPSGTPAFRLPTEAEWEYAAGGGAIANRTRFGNSRDIANSAEMNYYGIDFPGRESYSVVGEYRQKTLTVGSFAPNSLKLYDMTGNLYEWCNDWYGDYSTAAQTNPTGPGSGAKRVLRGGGWATGSKDCRIVNRDLGLIDYHNNGLGFRVVSSAQ